MQLARVVGTVVATVKAPNLDGVRLLIVQPLTRRLEPVGQPVVAADALETAGPGELVYFVAAREAAEAMPNRFVPVDHAVVGIADAVEMLAGGGQADGGQVAGSLKPAEKTRKPAEKTRKPRGSRR